ncbi:expressed protein [Phakopsora pachyrhizi]|uniref:Expressed protein n=1 Tax=Phakopsora pachyrhizi TaxID=170000 RepID=A0AAV0B019_PHAPC|nr:expressed protein [Phakopsora pachyrhizi]
MTGVEKPQSIVAQPVIKDVETLKAKLKEEKRARAAETEPKPKEDSENCKVPKANKGEIEEKKEDDDNDDERRKRRRVSEVGDGQASKTEHSAEPIKESVEELLESALPTSNAAPSDNGAEKLVKNDESVVAKPEDVPSEQAAAPARSLPETADLDSKEAEQAVADDVETSEDAELKANKTTPGPLNSAEKAEKLKKPSAKQV